MKARSTIALALALLVGAAALTGIGTGIAGAKPAHGAKPEVTAGDAADSVLSIFPWKHGVFGSLKTRGDDCADDRTIVVYGERGEEPDPSTDRRADVTHTPGPPAAGLWSAEDTGNLSPGRYYAEATATQKCGALISGIARVGGTPASDPEWGCGALVFQAECRYSAHVHVGTCDGARLSDPSGTCVDPSGLPCDCLITFSWDHSDGNSETSVRVSSHENPYVGMRAISRGNPTGLYPLSVAAGPYKSIYPPRGEPGNAGGPLLLSEGPYGTINIEGFLNPGV